MAGPFQVGRNVVLIDAPAKRVFEYLADLNHVSEWTHEPDFRVTRAPEGPPGSGAVLRREYSGVMRGPLIIRGGMSDNPLRVEKVSSIPVYEPNATLVVETRNSYNGLLHSIEKFSFELHSEMDGTRVTMVSEIEPMVPSMFIGPVYAIRVVRNIFGRLFGGVLAGMFPHASVGPHLARIKEKTEAAESANMV